MKQRTILLLLLCSLYMVTANAGVIQSANGADEVALVVSGTGATKEQAVKNALLSAIEQTFGTFVSSNTQILNDELIKDEVVTVSSGNVKSYDIVNETSIEGKYNVTLKALVSIGKLIEFTKSKGAEAELAGATFAMNIKIAQLQKENEEIALQNMFKEIESILPTIFDYEIKLSEPQEDKDNLYRVGVEVDVKTNANAKLIFNKMFSTLSALSVSSSPSKLFPYIIADKTVKLRNDVRKVSPRYCESNTWLEPLMLDYSLKFIVSDGIKQYKIATDHKGYGSLFVNTQEKDDYDREIWEYKEFFEYSGFSEYFILSKYRRYWNDDSGKEDRPVDLCTRYNFRFTDIDPTVIYDGLKFPYGEGMYDKWKFYLYYTLDEISKISNITVAPDNGTSKSYVRRDNYGEIHELKDYIEVSDKFGDYDSVAK